MGLELWAKSEDYAANCVTAVRCPDGIDVGATLLHIRERYGVMLSGGYGELKDKLFRLGHMGPAARSLNPVVAVGALGRGLADLGAEVNVGAGCEAALAVLSEARAGEAAHA
jgi:pyridoxamine--pyruvate transaminase